MGQWVGKVLTKRGIRGASTTLNLANWRRIDTHNANMSKHSQPAPLPTVKSPSGIFSYNSYGEQLNLEIAPRAKEAPQSWFGRLAARIPEVVVGSPLSQDHLSAIIKKTEYPLPAQLIELWQVAPGIRIRHDSFLFEPSQFLQQNAFYYGFVPEVPKQMVFFGGFDGFNGAIALGAEDTLAYEWSHEEGFTGLAAPSIMAYLSEALASYVTSMEPFCFTRGYVPRL